MKRAMVVVLVAGLLVTLGWMIMPFPWGHSAEPPPPGNGSGNGDAFGADREAPAFKAIAFDDARAMKYLQELCEFGPRLSGSATMKKQQKRLQEHFEKHGAKVRLQTFDGKQPSQRDAVSMANLIASWHPDRKSRVIFCGHYDTRPYADQEPDRRNWNKPFLSANDGTSTTAFLMEFAHHVGQIPMNVGIDFVIFDGEEYIFDTTRDRYFLGSEHFAAEYRKSRDGTQYRAAILLDLFAGKNAKLKVEPGSSFWAGGLVQQVWDIAADQKCDAFVWQMGREVLDDHLALNRVGIPAIDIIDFDYPHWHKLTDVPANCSGAIMKQVGTVLNIWLQIQP
ncbi:M28 family peptidase [Tuwongella immobilis]|uniref:Peptidase M28 domain-containing protein n=1 Tax=Tuwongella immobilis TaxID=692036 RepID=A0A6C2YNN1_9BACT|nr:M28 family peptidase [Tuwongella immobilis]VIP02665.1 Putative aminopeptidase OS=Singulisphaera acidiphila (strain ATCC BAA-1392 / DSM 18658 / VKM B-2454 / MOB10) GN=Sinac_5126 PE=4 SV=1: Peptidase_M28 [Tuwongella immobilis]VTS02084.1 Putative aminopeptidase OS=Singulisphaera acidiphila (strain ATCC BAA-1392 / DSM 18658 / VKM B-2454 / MOB10) GN=Sinac_5126 PE=4 SV=1: Peptidase_M28 [Tuwongella immobilis]